MPTRRGPHSLYCWALPTTWYPQHYGRFYLPALARGPLKSRRPCIIRASISPDGSGKNDDAYRQFANMLGEGSHSNPQAVNAKSAAYAEFADRLGLDDNDREHDDSQKSVPKQSLKKVEIDPEDYNIFDAMLEQTGGKGRKPVKGAKPYSRYTSKDAREGTNRLNQEQSKNINTDLVKPIDETSSRSVPGLTLTEEEKAQGYAVMMEEFGPGAHDGVAVSAPDDDTDDCETQSQQLLKPPERSEISGKQSESIHIDNVKPKEETSSPPVPGFGLTEEEKAQGYALMMEEFGLGAHDGVAVSTPDDDTDGCESQPSQLLKPPERSEFSGKQSENIHIDNVKPKEETSSPPVPGFGLTEEEKAQGYALMMEEFGLGAHDEAAVSTPDDVTDGCESQPSQLLKPPERPDAPNSVETITPSTHYAVSTDIQVEEDIQEGAKSVSLEPKPPRPFPDSASPSQETAQTVTSEYDDEVTEEGREPHNFETFKDDITLELSSPPTRPTPVHILSERAQMPAEEEKISTLEAPEIESDVQTSELITASVLAKPQRPQKLPAVSAGENSTLDFSAGSNRRKRFSRKQRVRSDGPPEVLQNPKLVYQSEEIH